MSKLDGLIKELCPNGVEYKFLWEVTTWDKKFNSVDRAKQKLVVNYPYMLAAELFNLEVENGNVFLLSTGEKTGWTDETTAGSNLCYGEVVSIPWGKSRPVKDVMKYYKGKFVTADNRLATSSDVNILLNKYLYYCMISKSEIIDKTYRGSGIKHPNMNEVLHIQIPLPPLPVQEEIVRILDNFTQLTAELTAELTARKKQYEYYHNSLLDFENKDIEYMSVGELFEIKNGLNKEKDAFGHGSPIVNFTDVFKNRWLTSDKFSGLVDVNSNEIERYSAKKGDVFFTRTSETKEDIGMSCTLVEDIPNCVFSGFVLRARPITNLLIPKFCAYYFSTQKSRKTIIRYAAFTTRATTTGPKLSKIQIPILQIAEQQRIVDILDRFDTLCNDISNGLPAEIKARRQQYEYYRDKLLTFNKLEGVDSDV